MKLNFSLLSIFILFQIVKCQERSLIFVTDITKSMKEDIEQVRDICSEILDKISGTEKKYISNYVLSMFRDPELEPIINTRNLQEITNALNEIKTGAGGDCPENSIAGIQAALEYALPNSIMFVFTDATAKDHHLGNEVLETLQAKKIAVSFVITPTTSPRCRNKDPLTGPGYEIYEEIAEQTKGMIMKMEKSEIKDTILNKLTDWLNPNFGILGIEYLKPSSVESEITVSNMKKLIIISTGDGELSATDPNNIVHESVVKGATKQIIISEPISGKWKISASSKIPFTIQTSGISEVTFEYGFSSTIARTVDATQPQPLPDVTNYLNIFISNPDAIKTLKHVKFVQQDGEEIEISLSKVNSRQYSSRAINIPKDLLKIYLVGIDKSNQELNILLSEAVLVDTEPNYSIVDHEIDVPKMIKLILTSTGDGGFTATDPDNILHESDFTDGTIKQITVNNPTPGKWLISANSSKKFDLGMSGETEATIQYGFSSTPVTSQDETQLQPLQDVKNYFHVFIGDSNDVKLLTHIKLIMKDGSVLSVNLRKKNEHQYSSRPFDIPDNLSKISLHGLDQSDTVFDKIMLEVAQVNFEYGFSSTKVTTKAETQGQPLEDDNNYLHVFVSDASNVKTLKHVMFILKDGSESKFNLRKVNDNLYRTNIVDIPDDLSKITVHGVDKLNTKFDMLISEKVS